jgi:pimeloyl-ACP methyl ester carboxylesterase
VSIGDGEGTTVLTIGALDLGVGRLINYMAKVCKGWAVAGDRKQIRVPTSGLLDPSAGDRPRGSIARGAKALDDLIRKTPGEKVVFGYSQGAQIAGQWLRTYAAKPDAPTTAELSFLLIGNPERRFGKQPWTKKITPDDTRYRVRDVARKGDRWANYKGVPAHRFAAMFGGTHTNYWKTDPFDPRGEVIEVSGFTQYVIVP